MLYITYRDLLTYQLREFHHHMFCCFIIMVQMYNRFLNDQIFILEKFKRITNCNLMSTSITFSITL